MKIKAQKKIKRLVIVALLATVGMLIAGASFLVLKEAPILKGPLQYNLSYSAERKLDLYLPTKNSKEVIPVLVFVHGGAWMTGRKESVNNGHFNDAFNQLRASGYAIVAPDYSLAKTGRSPFPMCIQDVYDALSWIKNNAEKYDFDTENVGIMGESAGGHLALMMGYADPINFGKKLDIKPQYIIDIYGPTDLFELYDSQKPLVASIDQYTSIAPSFIEEKIDINKNLFGFDPAQDLERAKIMAKEISPISYVDHEIPPTLIIHGDADRLVPLDQSLLLEEQLKLNNCRYQMEVLEGVDHAFIKANKDQKARVQNWIVDYVNGHYH